MKHITIIIAAILLSSGFLHAQVDRTQPPKAGKPAKIQLGESKTFKLDNGLTVILVENHELPTVTFSLQLAMEPVAEGKMSGTASMAGGLLRTGTTTRTKAKLDEEIDFIGANISTGQSSIEGSSLKKHQDKVLELMTDILYHPVFPQEEFDKLKKQTLAALAMSGTDPNSIASNVANVLRYGKNHPYGEPVTEETIGNITNDAVKEYYRTYFSPSIGYLIMIGDLRIGEAKELANKYFASWKPVPVSFGKFRDPAAFQGNRVAFVDKTGAVQSVITITNTFRLKPGDPDVLPAYLMNNILGGGVFSGRLMLNLREDKAYTYGASSGLTSDKLIGNFTAGAQVRNAVTDSAITQFLYEMRRLREEPVTPEDLRLTKNVMAGEFSRSLESPSTLAIFAMNIVRYNLPADYYATYLERLEKITVADVQSMAVKYLQPDNCIILVVGNKDEVADKLARFSASGKVEFFDRYGNLENAAAAITVPEGLTATGVVDLYLDAIGGKQMIQNIRQVETHATGSVEAMGRKVELAVETMQVAPDLNYQEMKMGQTVISKQVYNGQEGWVVAMGGSQDIVSPDLEKFRDGGRLFPELLYFTPGFRATLDGMEAVDGRPSYRLKVIYPSGMIETEFYEVLSGLKIRKISHMDTREQSIETMVELGDYRAVNGVKFPFSLKQHVGDQMIDIKVESITVDGPPNPALFKK
jgi:predicted Zn-dependent peptidase